MIPKDIETTEQWQVRWTAPGGGEVTRTGTEAQVRYMASTREPFSPVVECRSITVGPWRDPDAPEPAPVGPCGYEHHGDCTIDCSERTARDSLRAVNAWPAEEDHESDE